MSALSYVPIFMLLILWGEQWVVKIWVCMPEAPRGGRGQKKQVLQEKWEDISTREFYFGWHKYKRRCLTENLDLGPTQRGSYFI